MSRGVTVSFNADVARFASGVDKITNDLNKFQSNASRISRNINSALGVIGVGLSAAGLVAFAKSGIDALDKFHDLSKTLNIPVERLSGLSVAAKQSGTDLDGVANSVSKLSANMGKNSDKFREIGITATEPLEALKQVADIYNSIIDPAQKAAFASIVFGKSWQSIVPLLSEGGAAIGRMVTEGEKASGVTKKMTDDADKFNDQLTIMKAQLSGVTVNIVGGILPAMTDMLSKFREFTTGDSVESLTVKLNKLKVLRDDLQQPSIGNKINNFLFSDIDSVNKQIADVERKMRYLNNLSKTIKVGEFVQPSTTKEPDQNILKRFIGDEDKLKKAKDDLESLRKTAQSLTESVDPFAKRNTELALYVKLLDKTLLTQENFNKLSIESIAKAEKARSGAGMDKILEEAKLMNDSYDDSVEAMAALRKEGESLAASVDPIVQRNIELARYVELLNAGVISQETFDKAATRSIESAESAMKGSVEDMTAVLIGFQANIQRSIGSGLYDMMKGNFQNIGDAWIDMLERMAADAAAAQISAALFGADGGKKWFEAGISLLSAFSGGGAKTVSSGAAALSGSRALWPAAKGASFADGIAKFATGGIFNSPTQFAFASGGQFRNGLMGEAGPEAIMPLKRDGSGRLGITMAGMKNQAMTIVNNFILQQPADRRTQEQIASSAGLAVRRAIARNA